jgi:hypothetical protein
MQIMNPAGRLPFLRSILLAGLAWSASLFLMAHAAEDGQWGPKFSISEQGLKIAGVSADNPVIYDNDWWYDIIDAAYCVAQHKLGNLDLRGLIVTRDMWPSPQYKWEDSQKEFNRFRALALQSGLTTVPELIPGARDRLEKPASGKIPETEFKPSPGSNLIVAEARKASPDKPLIVVVGGAPTTVATALLQDPDIAKNLVVFWLAIREYNAKDEWASHLMLMRAPVVHYNFQLRNGLTQAQLQSLPDNPLCKKFKESQLVFDNGVGDGVLLAWLFDHSLLTGAEKQTITGLTGFSPTESRPYGMLHVHNHQKRSEAIAQQMVDLLKKVEVWNPE